MIYVGHFKPFLSRYASMIELINEVLIVVCTYHLIMFTSLVYDPDTRYLCGWPCIIVVFALIAMNLSVIVYQAITSIIYKSRLKYKRYQNIKLMK